MSDRQALTVVRPHELSLLRGEGPARGPGEVLLSPSLVGICGTDLDIIDGRIDPAFVRYPVVLGHEWSGVVVDPGSAADRLQPGDHAVVEGIVPCGRCGPCGAGDTNRCENYDEFGFVRDGAMASTLVAPARLVHRLEPAVSLESGALVEPSAVVLRALLEAGPRPGQRVLVIGDGTIGLIAARLARLWSPSSVDVLGQRAAQSALAALAGADRFMTDPSAVGTGFDLVVEAAGAAQAVRTAVGAAGRGGTILLLGFPGHGVDVPVPIDDLVNGDLTLRGSFGYTSAAWSHVVTLLNSGRLDLGFLVTHRFPVASWEAAIDALRHVDGARGKVLVDLRDQD